jgi:hypothetical protein
MRRALAVASLLLAGAPALAQDQGVTESPRLGSFTLEGATFTPDVDSAFAAPGPYEAVFGNGTSWMFRGEVAKTLYDGYGAIDVGLGLGYFSRTGKAILAGTSPPVQTADTTGLRILPVTGSATYRFDVLPRRYDVPVMLLAKGFVEWDYWWTTGLDGGKVKNGTTWGFGATGGVGILLDFIDRGMAREADRDMGINDTYLIFDVTKTWVNDFGSSSSWNLGTKDLSFGVGLLLVF